ncbi:hypothetical protein VST7929_00260 [Vibrio stylophorae]|uniref:DUF4870 domain-containing protein n=1 Tax=Vibrio stylophorae TaxID=659351 RepID=A0ABM8ZR96_9VIBR|nr:hypothetical protein [Vibrio stylophorae]CAH0532431.1 hypothetical protein VST7929_00260 [Vibrio stylophorae]
MSVPSVEEFKSMPQVKQAYLLYLTVILAIVGVFFSFVNREKGEEWEQAHCMYQLKNVVISLLASVAVGFVAGIIGMIAGFLGALIGLVLNIAVFGWLWYRSYLGYQDYLRSREPSVKGFLFE